MTGDPEATADRLAACHRMQTPLSFVEAGLSALEHALHERGDDLRNIQLATISPQGRPQIRTLVLRAFDRAAASAEMHTDARAAKVADIAADDRVSLLAWSAADHLQLRFDGTARLHRDDDVARSRWDRLSPKARDTYGLQTVPGVAIRDPQDHAHLPPDAQFRQFVVILVALTSLDVLRLEPDGGQLRARARFAASVLQADWVGP